MKAWSITITAGAICVGSLLFAAKPVQAGPQPKTTAECMGAQSVKTGGQMPQGALDVDIKSYESGDLCDTNKNRPVGEKCETNVKELIRVAKRINQMVKDGCAEFMPKISQVKSCMGAQKSHVTCTDDHKKTLNQLNMAIKAYRVELKNFYGAMKNVQDSIQESSEKVVNVIQDSEMNKGKPAYKQSGISAREMNESTLEQADRANGFQDHAYAQSLVQELRDKFSNKTYDSASLENYQKDLAPITETFKKLDSLKSIVLREQLHSYLKAEELKLASKANDNKMAALEKMTGNFIDADTKSNKGVDQLDSAQDSSKPSASGLGGAPSGGGAPGGGAPGGGQEYGGGGSGITSSYPEENLATEKNGKSKSKNDSANLGKKGKEGEPLSIGQDGPAEGSGELGGISSGNSRSPSSLRDALRERLRNSQSGGSGSPVTASGAGAAGGGSGGASGEKEKSDSGLLGVRGPDGSVLAGAGGTGGIDAPLDDFSGENLSEGGFQMAGVATDESVKGMLDEFAQSMDSEEPQGEDIGATDGPNLFLRVKEYHDRCLKRGCVLGTLKRHI